MKLCTFTLFTWIHWFSFAKTICKVWKYLIYKNKWVWETSIECIYQRQPKHGFVKCQIYNLPDISKIHTGSWLSDTAKWFFMFWIWIYILSICVFRFNNMTGSIELLQNYNMPSSVGLQRCLISLYLVLGSIRGYRRIFLFS